MIWSLKDVRGKVRGGVEVRKEWNGKGRAEGEGLGDERMDEWRVCIEQCMSIAMCENEMGWYTDID